MDDDKITLPSGGWVRLREVRAVTERYRRPIARSLSQLSSEGLVALQKMNEVTDSNELDIEKLALVNVHFSEPDIQRLSDANDACVVALVKEWSFPEPITLDSVLDRTTEDYDRLREVCAPAAGSLFLDFSMNKKNVENPDSPFVPSNGSGTS